MGSILQQAIIVASLAHKDQKRKGTEIPYIFHPMEVGQILSENKCRQEVIAAGILHDTIEDTALNSEAIQELFGPDIRKLVEAATEANRSDPWQQRKEHTLEFIKNKADFEEKCIICADKLSNVRSMYRDYLVEDDTLWNRFNEGYEKQKWYYEGLVVALDTGDMNNQIMFKELCELVLKVFRL